MKTPNALYPNVLIKENEAENRDSPTWRADGNMRSAEIISIGTIIKNLDGTAYVYIRDHGLEYDHPLSGSKTVYYSDDAKLTPHQIGEEKYHYINISDIRSHS